MDSFGGLGKDPTGREPPPSLPTSRTMWLWWCVSDFLIGGSESHFQLSTNHDGRFKNSRNTRENREG